MSNLHRILYCSRNCIPGGTDAVIAHIHEILEVSRGNNARDGITGGLMFSKGCFAQVLEGPIEAVEAAFERIQCDERHSDVVVLASGTIAARDFPEWSMAFSGASTSDDPLAGAVVHGALTGHTNASGEVLTLLKSLVARESEWLTPVT